MRRACYVISIFAAVAGGVVAENSLAQETGGRRVLVLGVLGTQTQANDPTDPRSIAEFTHNFSEIATLTHRAEGVRDRGTFGYLAQDLAWSTYEDVRGSLTQHSRTALEPLRISARDTIVAHSWGAMAVMYAIRDGVISAPGRLVIVNPPLISPGDSPVSLGGGPPTPLRFSLGRTREWRAFAERFPQLALDVYIGTDDLLNRLRIDAASGRYERYSPADALLPFVIPDKPARIRVRMYPGDHRWLGFLNFASRIGEYGLTPRPVGGSVNIAGPPIPDFLRKDVFQHGDSRYAYLFESGPGLARAQALARAVGIGREPQTRELLRATAERSAQQLARARWEFVSLLVATACESPYVLREWESRGLVPGIRIPLSDVRIGFERERRSMSKCQQDLFEEIIRNPENLSILTLADRGESYRREHNPFRVAARELSKLLAEIGDAFSAPISAGGTPSGGGGGGRENGGGGGRDSSGIDFRSPTFDQLRTGNFRW